MRNLTADQQAALEQGGFSFAYLLELGLTTAIYLTGYSHDISYGGRTYIASPHLTGLDDVELDGDIRVNELDIELSHVDYGIDQAMQAGWRNRPVTIKLALLNDQGLVIGAPITLHEGYWTTYNIDEDDESIITATIASIWADFEKKSGRSTTDGAQQRIYPGDTGMQYTARAKEAKGEWGHEDLGKG